MKTLNKVLGYIIAFMVGMMALVCCWQVITRFILNSPSKYTEEILRYALIWTTMLGVPYAYGQEKHISINIYTKTFGVKGGLADKLLVEVIVCILSITVFIIGGIMVTINSAGQISPALQMPMPLYYVGIPICGALTLPYSIQRIGKIVKEWKEAA